MKHTPGPWEVSDDHFNTNEHADKTHSILAPDGDNSPWIVAEITNAPESYGNAYLVAAAPELLEALKFYVSICGNTAYQISRKTAQEMYTKAQAALAKAEAE